MRIQDIQQRRHALALKNAYHSVVKCFPIDQVKEDSIFVGIKDVIQIPPSLLQTLQQSGPYDLHTLDAHSDGGRAVDLHIVNPISGRWMSGSSSGTAVNVLTGINDLGIGSDGGGSVLAPAISLNLFGFISCCIEADYVKNFPKKSTEGILFTPSIGYITREFSDLKKAVEASIPLPSLTSNEMNIWIDEHAQPYCDKIGKIVHLPNRYGARLPLIECCQSIIKECDILIGYEHHVDLEGFGDSIFGHFDEQTMKEQAAAKKGIIRIANMINATAISIPVSGLGCALILMCESKPLKIKLLLELAESIAKPQDPLIAHYFSSLYLQESQGYQLYEEDTI